MSKVNLIPELRFPEFKNEGEWIECSIESIGNIVTGGTPSKEDADFWGGDFVWATAQDFKEKYIWNSAQKLTLKGKEKSRVIPKDSVLVTCIASIGLNAINKVECATNQQINSIICNSDNHFEFIYYSITKNGNRLNNLAGRTAVPIISKSVFEKFTIQKPKSPQEQKKIASCLSSLDEVIAANNQKLDALKDHKKGLMQNLFPQEGETVPKYRFKEFENEWGKVKLKDVSAYFNGGSYENEVKADGRYELITLKSINTYGQLVNSKRYIDIEVPTLTKATLVMILSEQAPGLLGLTAVIPENKKYVLNQRVAEIRPNQKVESFFLSMAINRNQIYFSKQGAGTKVQNISKPNVENYEFLIPEILEQQKIASCLSSLDALITAQAEKIEQLKLHKKGLMQGLFPKINDI